MSTSVKEIEKTEVRKEKKELLLDSLEIKGYRCFEHLTIEKLGRVNLIVGKNNVGKTALLEALWIYSQNGSINELIKLLKKREQFSVDDEFGENLYQLNQIFYNVPNLFGSHSPITISSHLSKKLFLQIGVVWGEVKSNKEIEIIVFPTDSEEKRVDFYKHNSFICTVLDSDFKKIEQGKYEEIRDMYDVAGKDRILNFLVPNFVNLRSYLIDSRGLERKTTAEFWDRISLTDKEDLVIEALQIISPKIKRLTFIENKFYPSRIPVIRLEGMKNSEPLKNLGEGMDRILGIVLTLIRCETGFFLVDEIESGLHYSVLPDVWKLIFKMAKQLNIQVFATTHSYDCIQAFAEAAIEDEESDGMLIRLARKNDQIKAFTFDEKQLETITKEHIEVR